MRILRDIFVITRIIAFERYNFISRKMRPWSNFKQIWSNLLHCLIVMIDKMNGFVICLRPKYPTKRLQKNCWQKPDHHKTRSPQDYTIRREKGTRLSKATKTNPFRALTTTNHKHIKKTRTNGLHSTKRESWYPKGSVP